jgi:Aspartyl/Asparaginyl beta-hydroxylase
MLKYLRLPFTFDAALIQQEAMALGAEYWKLHYNAVNYEGKWSALPLYSLDGKPGAIYAIHSSSGVNADYQPTPLLESCPYIRFVLNELQFPKRAVRLMRLEAGAIIKEHSDHQLAYEEGEVRLHMPVQTNELVEFYVQGERMAMREGELWYLNLTLPHRVANHGTCDRIHLVIDGMVNDWLREQFARPDIEIRKDADEAEPGYDDETRRRMIEELRIMGTGTALRLAEALGT